MDDRSPSTTMTLARRHFSTGVKSYRDEILIAQGGGLRLRWGLQLRSALDRFGT